MSEKKLTQVETWLIENHSKNGKWINSNQSTLKLAFDSIAFLSDNDKQLMLQFKLSHDNNEEELTELIDNNKVYEIQRTTQYGQISSKFFDGRLTIVVSDSLYRIERIIK